MDEYLMTKTSPSGGHLQKKFDAVSSALLSTNSHLTAIPKFQAILFNHGWQRFDRLPKPLLTYWVSEQRATIFGKDVSNVLTVSAKGEVITDNVTAAYIAVWNDGDAPIRSTDVLSPCTISSEPAVRILEVKLINQTRNEIGASLVRADGESSAFLEDIRNGRFETAWRILEPNDGFRIQVT